MSTDAMSASTSSSDQKSNVQEYLKLTTATKCAFIKTEPVIGGEEMDSQALSPILDIEMTCVDANPPPQDATRTDITNLKTESTIVTLDSKQQQQIQQPNKATQKFRTSANETAFTLQSLVQLSQMSTCKFCESFLADDDSSQTTSYIGSGEFENKENLNGETKQQAIQFCSEFCMNAYKKLLIIRKNKLESSKLKAASEEILSQSKESHLNDSHKELEDKKVIRTVNG